MNALRPIFVLGNGRNRPVPFREGCPNETACGHQRHEYGATIALTCYSLLSALIRQHQTLWILIEQQDRVIGLQKAACSRGKHQLLIAKLMFASSEIEMHPFVIQANPIVDDVTIAINKHLSADSLEQWPAVLKKQWLDVKDFISGLAWTDGSEGLSGVSRTELKTWLIARLEALRDNEFAVTSEMGRLPIADKLNEFVDPDGVTEAKTVNHSIFELIRLAITVPADGIFIQALYRTDSGTPAE